jgi:NAD-dependent dihydropyrimidine dehydrogenase PreA subunit
MAYAIASECADNRERTCVEVCPVDCIYEGADQLYIHPEECIDCGACEPECPVTAISYAEDGDEDVERAKRFFFDILPGRDVPLGSPGSARKLGVIDASA